MTFFRRNSQIKEYRKMQQKYGPALMHESLGEEMNTLSGKMQKICDKRYVIPANLQKRAQAIAIMRKMADNLDAYFHVLGLEKEWIKMIEKERV